MSSSDEPKRPARRDFLGLAVGGSAAAFAVAVGYQVARFAEPPARGTPGPVIAGKVEEFSVGAAKTVMLGDRPVLVLRGADGELRAFSALCTHLQCVVGYSAERNQIECPCHRGVYSVDGRNIAGPPPRPLDELVVHVSEGAVIVSLA